MKKEEMLMQDAMKIINLAALKLLRAENEREVQSGLEYIRAAMGFGIPPQAVQYFIRLMKEAAREEAAAHAQEAFGESPSLFPARMPALFQEAEALLAKCPEAEEWANSPDSGLRYSLNGLSICETAASVHAFAAAMYKNMEESGQSRRADMQSLLYAIKDEIIVDYLKSFDRLPERTSRQEYTASLLAALDIIVHYEYPLNLLFYSRGVFEVITAETLLKETGILRLRRKLRVMCVAMGDMEPEVLDWFCGELTWEIPQAVIRILKTPCVEERLSGDTRFCLDCLEEIRHAGIAEVAAPDNIPRGSDELTNLLAAQSALNTLCIHRDTDAFKKSWQEFLNCAAACPGCSDMLERHTREALTVRVFSGMTELSDFYLPITMMCLMRFYMALTFSPTRISYDAGLSRRVILGHK